MAVVTNSQDFGGLKQHKFYSLIVPEAWNPKSFQQAEIKVIAMLNCLHRFKGTIWCLLLPASGGCQHSLICSHLPPISDSVITFPPLPVCVSHLPLSPSRKDSCDWFRVHPNNPEELLILCHMKWEIQFPGVRTWGHVSAYCKTFSYISFLKAILGEMYHIFNPSWAEKENESKRHILAHS